MDGDGVKAEIVQADEVKESMHHVLSRLELALTNPTPPSRLPDTPAVQTPKPPMADATERRVFSEDETDK